jgi:hypothetical protein
MISAEAEQWGLRVAFQPNVLARADKVIR